jgi:hypothetical protein
MAEKIKINLSNGQKKSSDEQFLKESRNWESSSALTTFPFSRSMGSPGQTVLPMH